MRGLTQGNIGARCRAGRLNERSRECAAQAGLASHGIWFRGDSMGWSQRPSARTICSSGSSVVAIELARRLDNSGGWGGVPRTRQLRNKDGPEGELHTVPLKKTVGENPQCATQQADGLIIVRIFGATAELHASSQSRCRNVSEMAPPSCNTRNLWQQLAKPQRRVRYDAM